MTQIKLMILFLESKLWEKSFSIVLFRMEGFMAEFCDLKSYRKTSRGLLFERKRKVFDNFVRFKKKVKKPKFPSGLSFEV